MHEAYLAPECEKSERGANLVCRAKRILGCFAVKTVYVSFEQGKVAAVKILNQPPFFDTFTASIRHRKIDGKNSEVIYKVNFTAATDFEFVDASRFRLGNVQTSAGVEDFLQSKVSSQSADKELLLNH